MALCSRILKDQFTSLRALRGCPCPSRHTLSPGCFVPKSHLARFLWLAAWVGGVRLTANQRACLCYGLDPAEQHSVRHVILILNKTVLSYISKNVLLVCHLRWYIPAIQVNSAWPSLHGCVHLVAAKAGR